MLARILEIFLKSILLCSYQKSLSRPLISLIHVSQRLFIFPYFLGYDLIFGVYETFALWTAPTERKKTVDTISRCDPFESFASCAFHQRIRIFPQNFITKIMCFSIDRPKHQNIAGEMSTAGQEPILPAVLEFPETHQEPFLRQVISDLDVNVPNFKLAPVYTLYLCAR